MFSNFSEENCRIVRRLLRSRGLRPRRENGQHFLIDADVVAKLVHASGVGKEDTVLEIGPGLGIVTEQLLKTGSRVVAVELDQNLAELLQETFVKERLLRIVQGDVLKLRLEEFVEDGHYHLVSSLPYNITSLVLRTFLEQAPRPMSLTLLIQKEVADRVTALPGEMSMLSVAVQYLGKPEWVDAAPRTCFEPVPDVDGAIIRVGVRPMPDPKELQNVLRIARMGFSSRRKMLRNNLEGALHSERGDILASLHSAGLNERCRAQDLTIEQWKKLAGKLL